MINQKITFPRDFNFSDDELAFMQYFVYFHTLKVSGDYRMSAVCYYSVVLVGAESPAR